MQNIKNKKKILKKKKRKERKSVMPLKSWLKNGTWSLLPVFQWTKQVT